MRLCLWFGSLTAQCIVCETTPAQRGKGPLRWFSTATADLGPVTTTRIRESLLHCASQLATFRVVRLSGGSLWCVRTTPRSSSSFCCCSVHKQAMFSLFGKGKSSRPDDPAAAKQAAAAAGSGGTLSPAEFSSAAATALAAASDSPAAAPPAPSTGRHLQGIDIVVDLDDLRPNEVVTELKVRAGTARVPGHGTGQLTPLCCSCCTPTHRCSPSRWLRRTSSWSRHSWWLSATPTSATASRPATSGPWTATQAGGPCSRATLLACPPWLSSAPATTCWPACPCR